MPARNTYICKNGHKFEHVRKHGEEAPTKCLKEKKCAEPVEISWDCEPGDYFGTMGLINRL